MKNMIDFDFSKPFDAVPHDILFLCILFFSFPTYSTVYLSLLNFISPISGHKPCFFKSSIVIANIFELFNLGELG